MKDGTAIGTVKGDCYCRNTTITTTTGTAKTTTVETDVIAITETAITMMVVTTTVGNPRTITVESENGKWRNLNWCCGTVRLS